MKKGAGYLLRYSSRDECACESVIYDDGEDRRRCFEELGRVVVAIMRG